MVVIAGLLVGISTGCAAWLFIHQRMSRQLVAQRISDIPRQISFPNNINLRSLLRSNKKKEITLEDMASDRIAKNLFLAGYHNYRAVQVFHIIVKLSLAIPCFLIISQALQGKLDLKRSMSALLAGIIIYLYTHLILKIAREKRQKLILRSLPQFLDLLVVCVEAGLSFTAALERILKEMEKVNPLTKELKIMYNEFLGGLSLKQACERLDKRCDVPDLSLLLTSIVQSDQMGASLGNTLRTQATEIRDKYRQRVRTRALKIPVKILFPMIPIFLAFMLINLGIIGFQLNNAIGNNKSPQNTQKIAKTTKEIKNVYH